MPYVSLDNLSQFWGNAKKYVDARDACYANWHRTETAGAVACYPVPESELHPVVNFSFTETPPASGEKGPDNPSTITGVSSVRVGRIGGKNLLAYNFSTGIVPVGTPWGTNPTITNNAGTYTIVGTHTDAGIKNYYIVHVTDEKVVIPAGTYTISGYTAPSGAPITTGLQVAWYNPETGSPIDSYRLTSGSYTFTVDRPVALNVYFRMASNTTYPDGFTCSPQLEFGDTATAFESSRVDLYDIPLGNTYYGGSIDLATGLMTVTHVSLEINENISFSTSGFYESDTAYIFKLYILRDTIRPSINNVALNRGVVTVSANSTNTTGVAFTSNSSAVNVCFAKSDIEAIAGLDREGALALAKDWLTTHPMQLVFPLATPQLVQLTPQQLKALPALDKYEPRLNTLYTDADSIQVGYQKSPIQTERELTNAILALGSN